MDHCVDSQASREKEMADFYGLKLSKRMEFCVEENSPLKYHHLSNADDMMGIVVVVVLRLNGLPSLQHSLLGGYLLNSYVPY